MDEKDTLRRMLEQVCAEEAGELEAMGVAPSYANLILLMQVKKAARGDASAGRFLRELLEENREDSVSPGDLPEFSAFTDAELLAALEAPDDEP